MSEPTRQATELLRRAGDGDERAQEELLALVYDELHALAERQMRAERPDHTLQATVLVHEAWMKLIGSGEAGTNEEPPPRWRSRAHFLCTAAKAMRNVLVDHARARRSRKRSPPEERVVLDEAIAACESRSLDVLALDEALQRLASYDAELARVVELRFFGGLTLEETGGVLGLSRRQIEGAWLLARGWLGRELGAESAS